MQATKISITTTEQVNGKKATLLIENQLGLIVTRQVTLLAIELQKPYPSAYYYQLVVIYTERGKKKATGFKYNKIAIFEEWQDVAPENTNEIIVAEFNEAKFEAAKAKLKNLIYEHDSEKAFCYLYN